MMCGYLPFEDVNTTVLYQTILKGEFEIPDWLTPTSISILKGLMCVDPATRLTLKEIWQHPFITKYKVAQTPDIHNQSAQIMPKNLRQTSNPLLSMT